MLKFELKQLMKVFGFFLLSLFFIILLSKSIESELSQTFDKQAASEQAKILETLIHSNMYELNAQTRIWLRGPGPEVLKNKTFNKDLWENSLLGFGNSTSAIFGNTRFILYNSLGHVLNNYKTEQSSPALNLENENFNNVLNTAVDNESYENEFISVDDDSINQIIIYPIEDEDYEVSHYFVMVLDLSKILTLFKEVTQQDLVIENKGFISSSEQGKKTYKLSTSGNYIKNETSYARREINASFLFPSIPKIKVFTYVDTTKMYDKVHQVRNKIAFLFSLVFLIFSIFYLSVMKKYNTQKAVSYESSRLASLGEMAGGIAHEINNPLTIIKGHAFRLKVLSEKDKITKVDITTYSEKIIEVVNRISQIVHSLKKISREDKNSPKESISTEMILQDALYLSSQKFKSRGVELTYENPIKDVTINCRPVEVSRVLINLLNNAFDAVKESSTKNKSVKIIVKKEKGFARFDIVDNGDGISKDNLAKIMTPFFTTKPVGLGTGLGLSLSLTIIEAHGGSINVNSEPGNTVFSVRLPLTDSI